MSIEAFAFKNKGYGETLFLTGFEVYMGLTDNENLSAVFEDNYLPGTRTLVLQEDSVTYAAGTEEWCIIPLDTPFPYETGHHLLIEYLWTGGYTGMHNYVWTTTTDRAVLAYNPSSATGSNQSKMIHLLLTGTELNLEQTTFGAVKIILGNP
ncbi:MAG: hypothetical protein KAH54_00020 [Candidatus Sabulitectum sp.]|nr:hypothetical protein [Candidatus Sabulitectum sp.]